jgi:hypothetical protein
VVTRDAGSTGSIARSFSSTDTRAADRADVMTVPY